jgi:hypothetical protein
MASVERHETGTPGISYVEAADGTRTYIATWMEERPLDIADPLTTRRRMVERRAATFEEARRLKAEGEAAEREGGRPQSPVKRLAERTMAAKWFEYWVRR